MKIAKTTAKLARAFRIDHGKSFRLKDFDPGDTHGFEANQKDKTKAEELLARHIAATADLQEKLYAQDQWKVSTKLTLDYGTRFAWVKPPTLQTGGNFVPTLYTAANAPGMYKPCRSGSQTGVCDPTNGSFVGNSTLSGLFVPSAVANPAQLGNGTITTTNHAGYPGGLIYGTGLQFAPRLGFAYDVFGNSRTAIRGGFGIFINPATQIGQEGDMTHNPPKEYTTTVYYDNVKNLQLKWTWAINDSGANQTTPIVHNGVIYIASPSNIVQALDGKTGDLIWETRVGPDQEHGKPYGASQK